MKVVSAWCILSVLLSSASMLGEEHPVEGNPKSVVRVVAYEDLQCPDCAAYRRMMDEQLLPKYGKLVAFEHRDFPLAKHAWAKRAAVAARFFDRVRPALGIEFRQWAMANLSGITPANFDSKVSEWAASHGVSGAGLQAAAQDPSLIRLVNADYEEGVARGVARTPTVFVNAEPFIETFTVEEISKSIDQALAGQK